MHGVTKVLNINIIRIMKDYFNLPMVAQDEERGAIYVSLEVVGRVYDLIIAQRKFFRTRDKKLLAECKRREDGFVNWYLELLNKIGRK